MELWSLFNNFGTSQFWTPEPPKPEPPLQTRVLSAPLSESSIQKRVLSESNANFGTSAFWTPNTPVLRPKVQSRVLSASDALQKIQRKKRPRIRIRNNKRPSSRISAQASHSHESKKSEEKPQVVFFPTSQDQNSDSAKCQDAEAQGNGFNAFAFLGFLVSVFNAVR